MDFVNTAKVGSLARFGSEEAGWSQLKSESSERRETEHLRRSQQASSRQTVGARETLGTIGKVLRSARERRTERPHEKRCIKSFGTKKTHWKRQTEKPSEMTT
jgi:hypothetical protein